MRNNSTIIQHFLLRLTVHLKSTQTLLVLLTKMGDKKDLK